MTRTRFVVDAEELGRKIQTLVNEECSILNCTLFTSADGVQSYKIYVVPPNTRHLLRHVVGKCASAFLLVGKAPNEDEVEPESAQVLARIKTERLPIGSSISQEIFHLCGSEALHSSNGQNCTDEFSLRQRSFEPVSLESARYLLSLYSYLLRNNASDVLPLWCLVEQSNRRSIALLAAVPEAHVVFTCSAEPINVKNSLPDIAVYEKQHLSGRGGIGFVTTHGYALYEVMGSAGCDEDSIQSKIIVELAWDQVDMLFQSPPHSCEGVVHIKCVPGNEHFATYPLYLEVQRLEELSLLLGDQDLPWPTADEENTEPVAQKMYDFLQELNSGRAFSTTTEVDPADSPKLQLAFPEFGRKDLDFTEQLWLVLKDACDHEDLLASLRIIMSALFSGTCQPVIHTTNKTAFAELIRGILHCETTRTQQELQKRAEEYSTITGAIQLLVEIGADKLGRDYSQSLLREELVTAGQLTHFLDAKSPVMSRVLSTKQLHQIVELVFMAKSIIKLEHENLRTLAQEALVFYSTHSTDALPMFSLALPAFGAASGTSVKNICSNSQPSVWCMTMNSKLKKKADTTVVQLSRYHPTKCPSNFSFLLDESDVGEEVFPGDTSEEKPMYYLSCARKTVLSLY